MAKKVSLEDDDIDEVALADDDVPPAGPPVAVEEEPRPRGKNTGLTIALCVANALAALAFTYLLVLDFQKRQDWSYAVFMNELYIQGLPLQEEDDGPTASRVTTPRQRLESKQINDVFSPRGGKGGGENAFWTVDEPFPNRIRPTDLTKEVLKDYFGNQGVPVATLEEEVKRLKKEVPKDIARAAQETVTALKGADDAAKRQFAARLLLPLAYDVYQVEAIDRALKGAKGPKLDARIQEAVQRSLLVGILAPCEIFRPGDVGKTVKDKSGKDKFEPKFFVEKAGDLDYSKVEDLEKLLDQRFDVAIADKFDGTVHQGPDWDAVKRLSWEKRQTIGFLLLAIANLHKPDVSQPAQFKLVLLYPETGAAAGAPNLLRAQTVLGLYEFAAAAQNLPLAWRSLEEQLLEATRIDRQGFDIVFNGKGKDVQSRALDGKLVRNQAFIDKRAAEIKQIRELTVQLKKAEDRLKDLQEQDSTVKKNFEIREEHLKAMTKNLLEARKETAKQVAELRVKEKQLFQAQEVLRDAAERNAQLEKEIRNEERKATGVKTP